MIDKFEVFAYLVVILLLVLVRRNRKLFVQTELPSHRVISMKPFRRPIPPRPRPLAQEPHFELDWRRERPEVKRTLRKVERFEKVRGTSDLLEKNVAKILLGKNFKAKKEFPKLEFAKTDFAKPERLLRIEAQSPYFEGLRAPPPSPASDYVSSVKLVEGLEFYQEYVRPPVPAPPPPIDTDNERRRSYLKKQVTDGEVMLTINEFDLCLIFVFGIEYHYVVPKSGGVPSWELPRGLQQRCASWFLPFEKVKQQKFNLFKPPLPLAHEVQQTSAPFY